MKVDINFLVRVLFLFTVGGCSTAPRTGNSCEKIRAAFDIGSGETRMNIAKVNVCENKIVAELFQAREKIAFKDNTKNKELSKEIQEQGLQILKQMKDLASPHKVDRYIAVATSGFRDATNGEAYASKINRQLDLNLQIISQKQEAEVGYYAALAVAPVSADRTVVWDIGGGSQQIIFQNIEDQFETYQGKMASIGFKDRVLKEIVKRAGPSPNPLNVKQMKLAIAMAAAFAAQDIPEKIKTVISDKNSRVIGIGSVHYFSIYKQVLNSTSAKINQKQIVDLTKLFTNKSDLHFPGQKYVDTTITNVALVAGMMQSLQIPQIEIYDANLTHGLMLHPDFW